MKDKVLRKLLEVEDENDCSFSEDVFRKEIWVSKRLKKIESKLETLWNLNFVQNYFFGCPCCSGGKEILKSEAKSFKKLSFSRSFISSRYVEIVYTTDKGYKNHLPAIKKMEDEARKFEQKKLKK